MRSGAGARPPEVITVRVSSPSGAIFKHRRAAAVVDQGLHFLALAQRAAKVAVQSRSLGQRRPAAVPLANPRHVVAKIIGAFLLGRCGGGFDRFQAEIQELHTCNRAP
jgi:hypothetical protein